MEEEGTVRINFIHDARFLSSVSFSALWHGGLSYESY
jgi:hypothetical protein